MANVEWFHIVFLAIGIVLEISANIFLKLSDGFKKIPIGILSIVAIVASFGALSLSIRGENGFDLPIAYALWGGLGILVTTVAGRILFKQKFNKKGYFGLGMLILGMTILKFS